MICALCLLVAATACAPRDGRAEPPATAPALKMVVMDPLAAPLACDCVAGYAQRRYDKLADYLGQRLGRPVSVAFAESLERAGVKPDLVVGKDSVVRFDAAAMHLTVRPLARLTGLDGKTTQTGLFVVPRDDPAQTIGDLKGYQVFLGPPEADEKHAAALAALRAAGVAVPEKPRTFSSCSEAALEALDYQGPGRTAAVISSYARPLLEGCGTIERGSLRVVGHTEPVPFVTVFVAASVSEEDAKKVLEALASIRDDPKLLEALESKQGFVPVEQKPEGRKGKDSASCAWPGFRGPGRDGRVAWLPERLPPEPHVVWKRALTGAGLSGLVADDELLIVADRDRLDTHDVFRCLDAKTGAERWTLEYPARGNLDYGNSPRATPLLHNGLAYLLGAFGHLHCVEAADGRVVWKKHLPGAFAAKLPTWGFCASPLLVDGKLIVNPGAPVASLVALDAATGSVAWQSPGAPAAYASFIVGTFGGVRQIVGYDAVSLGGWEPETGRRLWQLIPPESGDFNVPTPLDAGGQLLVSTENNGTRLYDFNADGTIRPVPVAENLELAPDTATPVLAGGRLFGVWGDLFCLDPGAGLGVLWTAVDPGFEDFVSLLATDRRLLVTTCEGELLLIRTDGGTYELVGRQQVFSRGGEQSEVYSHPALVGTRLYLRDDSTICCVELADN